MSQRWTLSDESLHAALATRAHGAHTTTDVVRDIQAAVRSVPQGGRWSWPRVSSRGFLPVLLLMALVPIVAGVLIVGGRADLAESIGPGTIAYVRSTYSCGSEPCRLWEALAPAGLRAESSQILVTDGDAPPTPILDVPGVSNVPGGWSNDDSRSLDLAGPAVVWSPDGRRIAFRLFNDVPGIYVADRDGAHLRRLVEVEGDRGSGMGLGPGLAWSPDGTRIAFTDPYGGFQQGLKAVHIQDGRIDLVNDHATRAITWSPDGERIAFVRTSSYRTSQLLVADADGTRTAHLRRAEQPGYHITAVAWSPDGSLIAFERSGDSRSSGSWSGLWGISPEGSRLRRLDPEPTSGGCCILMAEDGPLEWSPDGTRIASRYRVVDIAAGTEQVLGPGIPAPAGFGPVRWFAWSQDGTRLVVAHGPVFPDGGPDVQVLPTEPWSTISIVDADGTGWRDIGPGEFPDWAP